LVINLNYNIVGTSKDALGFILKIFIINTIWSIIYIPYLRVLNTFSGFFLTKKIDANFNIYFPMDLYYSFSFSINSPLELSIVDLSALCNWPIAALVTPYLLAISSKVLFFLRYCK